MKEWISLEGAAQRLGVDIDEIKALIENKSLEGKEELGITYVDKASLYAAAGKLHYMGDSRVTLQSIEVMLKSQGKGVQKEPSTEVAAPAAPLPLLEEEPVPQKEPEVKEVIEETVETEEKTEVPKQTDTEEEAFETLSAGQSVAVLRILLENERMKGKLEVYDNLYASGAI